MYQTGRCTAGPTPGQNLTCALRAFLSLLKRPRKTLARTAILLRAVRSKVFSAAVGGEPL